MNWVTINDTLITIGNATKLNADFTPGQITFWTVSYSIINVMGVVANFTIIWIVLAHKRMRTATNLYLVNLAFSEAFGATLNIPFNIYRVLTSHWPFGWLLCKVDQAISASSMCTSVLTLSVIAIHRYVAIIHPFKRKLNITKTFLIIGGIWLISSIITAPKWMYITITKLVYGAESSMCEQIWPNHDLKLMYNYFYFVVGCVLPLVCMIYTYSQISLRLWGSKPVGEQNEIQFTHENAKWNAAKMMILVVLIFMICWMPYRIFYLVLNCSTNLNWDWKPTYLAVFWLAMSHPIYSPIIYCMLCGKFRTGFRKLFKFLPFINYDPAEWESHFSSSLK